MEEHFTFGKELGLVHKAIITGRKVGVTKSFWAKLADDENLFRQVIDIVYPKRSYEIEVYYGQSLRDMLQYAQNNNYSLDGIRKGFSEIKNQLLTSALSYSRRRTITLLYFNTDYHSSHMPDYMKGFSREFILREMDARGLKPAGHEELLALASEVLINEPAAALRETLEISGRAQDEFVLWIGKPHKYAPRGIFLEPYQGNNFITKTLPYNFRFAAVPKRS